MFDSSHGIDTRHIAVIAVVLMVGLAGCSFFDSGESDLGPQEVSDDALESTDNPEILQQVLESLEPEMAASFKRAVLDEEQERMTSDGEKLLAQLEEIEQLGTDQRDAVAFSIAERGRIDSGTLASIDRILESTEQFQTEAFRHGLADENGDGLLDGETVALGLDASGVSGRVTEFARQLSTDGFTSVEIQFVERVMDFSDEEWTQATHLDVQTTVESGSVSEDTLWLLEDGSGDGLLNGMARELEVDPQESHDQIAGFARQLSDEGYESSDITFLQRVSTFSAFEWTQATHLDIQSTVEDGSISETELSMLVDDSGDGLLNGVARELGLSPSESHPQVATVANDFGDFAFVELGLDYLTRYSTIVNDEFAWEQATYLGLTDPKEDGVLSAEDLEAISDDSGDGLLNAMHTELGLDQDEQYSDIAGVAKSLSQGGYDELEITYIEQLEGMRIYRGHEYEMWAQAQQLGYFDRAVANGTVTGRQIQYLWNNDSDRLLNGMELEIGTDPLNADTSNDGYADHLKWGPMKDLGLDVHPAEPDIYVEVDAAEGTTLPSENQVEMIETTFEEEPSDEIGPIHINFHLCDGGVQPASEAQDMDDITENNRELGGLGFHYLLMNDEGFNRGTGTVQGQTLPRPNGTSWIWVDGSLEEEFSDAFEAAVIAHELGHTLGLLDQFDGIDTWEYDLDEYFSVMNYNHNRTVTYSTGKPFNDYEEMADQKFGSYHQTTEELEQMWKNGTAEEEALC